MVIAVNIKLQVNRLYRSLSDLRKPPTRRYFTRFRTFPRRKRWWNPATLRIVAAAIHRNVHSSVRSLFKRCVIWKWNAVPTFLFYFFGIACIARIMASPVNRSRITSFILKREKKVSRLANLKKELFCLGFKTKIANKRSIFYHFLHCELENTYVEFCGYIKKLIIDFRVVLFI